MSSQPFITRRQQHGISLFECLLSLLVVGILLAMSLPALQQLKQRQQIQAIAQTLMTDLQLARNEAVLQLNPIQLRFSQSTQGSCYVMFRAGDGQCSCDEQGEPQCTAPGLLIKSAWLPSTLALTVRSNVGQLNFQARQGAVTSTGSIEIASNDGRNAIRQVVSIAGRVRSCAVKGFTQMPSCAV
jgi:Tfp pilus assembly protein FimT